MEAPNVEKSTNHYKPSSSINLPSTSCLKTKSISMQKEKGKQKVDDLVFDLTKDHDSNPNSYRKAVTESKNRVFSCKYCTMKFHSSQALGGHQNGHKREREIARQKQHHQDAAVLHRVSASALRFHGSPGRSLGMQVHSSIHYHKPIYGGDPMYGGLQPLHQQPWPAVVAEAGGASATRFHGGWRVPGRVVRWDSSSDLKTDTDQLDLTLKL